jgi:hypothetical protein
MGTRRVFMCRIEAVICRGPQNKAGSKSTGTNARLLPKGTVVNGLKTSIGVILFGLCSFPKYICGERNKIDKIIYPF